MALPYVFRLCEAFNLPVVRVPGWEADDVIGNARQNRRKNPALSPTWLRPTRTTVSWSPIAPLSVNRGAPVTRKFKASKKILEKWQIERVDQVIDILGLMGDSSDNVPGVPGVGEKTAQN